MPFVNFRVISPHSYTENKVQATQKTKCKKVYSFTSLKYVKDKFLVC